jgi:hypothetical protein
VDFKALGVAEKLNGISDEIRNAEAWLQKQNVPFDFE